MRIVFLCELLKTNTALKHKKGGCEETEIPVPALLCVLID